MILVIGNKGSATLCVVLYEGHLMALGRMGQIRVMSGCLAQNACMFLYLGVMCKASGWTV